MSQFIPASTSTTDRYYPSNSTIDGQPATGFKLGTSSLAGVFTSEALGASLTGDKKLSFYAVAWTGKAATVYKMCIRDRLFSPSRIRAVDIFATNLFAMLPTIVILGVLSVPSKWLGGLVCEPRSACEVMKLAGYNLIVILLSVSMAWSMVWGCFAYLVSGNMKGWRGISIFVICYVFVSVVNQLLIAYSK